MKRFFRLVAAMVIVPMAGCFQQAPTTNAPTPDDLYASLARPGAKLDPTVARDMFSIYRRNNGRSLLQLDPALQRIAEQQVRAMAARGGADRNVRSGLKDLLAREQVRYTTAVQNVSSGYHTLPEAFAGWRQSQPHNANLLNRKVRRMGIATAFVPATKYRVYWALVLAD